MNEHGRSFAYHLSASNGQAGLVTLEFARVRLLMLLFVFAVAFFALMARTVSLGFSGAPVLGRPKGQLVAEATLQNKSATEAVEAQSLSVALALNVEASRADIVDRNGELLATSLESTSLSANPRQIKDAKALARALARIIPSVSAAAFEEELSADKSFVWLHRQLTPQQKWEVNALGEPALQFHKTEERIYPHGGLAAHVLGRVAASGKGDMGLENFFNGRLADPGRVGVPLQTSLDVRVQYALADELAAAMRVQEAVGAAGLVMDIHTGEVIAMVSLPDFDPNVGVSDADSKRLFNRVTQGSYELGSVFKTFTVAAALDNNIVKLSGGYDATKPLRVGRFTIRDDHPKERYLSVPEIFIYSSNIGSALMATDLGAERQEKFLRSLGFMQRPSIELPGATSGFGPGQWGPVETMTISYGHGISASPLQMATAFSAMVNGGKLIPATLIKNSDTVAGQGVQADGRQVISPATSRAVRQLTRMAVMKGTGRSANAAGYRVGGKTGTAEKPGAGGYDSSRVMASFMSAFPMDDPRYVVLAVLDEPKGRDNQWGFRSAGWTAAPVVKNVVMRVAPLLGVQPKTEDEQIYRQVALLLEDE